MHALMMCGRTVMPARVIAMTYGEAAAVPVLDMRSGSLYGTSMPVTRIPAICFEDSARSPDEGDDVTHVEEHDPLEHPPHSLGNVATWTLGFRSSTDSESEVVS